MSVIKISQLDALNEAVATTDFFPLVNSSSMTTYRVDITALNVWNAASGSALSASNALTSSYSISASNALSASYALSASNALSASYALSASWAPQPTIPTTIESATSASWASRSFYSTSASLADNVSLQGSRGYVPYYSGSEAWVYGGRNSGLSYSSPMQVTRSTYGLPGVASLSDIGLLGVSQNAILEGTYSNIGLGLPSHRLADVTESYWFNPLANTYDGAGVYGVYGMSVPGPVIGTFIGTDQIKYNISTASIAQYTNLVWSGSSASGSYKTISAGNGQISQSFNGKWVRIAAQSLWDGGVIAPNSARHESAQGYNAGAAGFFGRVRIVVATNVEPASNVTQVVDMNINDQMWNGNVSARVDYAGVYQTDIIKKIRITSNQPYSSSADYYPGTIYSRDPIMAIDLYLDNLNLYDNRLIIGCYSWGGVKFLRELNMEPPELENTGSKGSTTPNSSSYLIFPPEPGHYSTQDRTERNYNLHGLPVSICPTRNVITGSAKDNASRQNPYSLDVSGSVHADSYYVTSASVHVVGYSGKIKAYEPGNPTMKTMTFVNGILTGFV